MWLNAPNLLHLVTDPWWSLMRYFTQQHPQWSRHLSRLLGVVCMYRPPLLQKSCLILNLSIPYFRKQAENPLDSYDGIGNSDIIPNHICRATVNKLFKGIKSILFLLWIWLTVIVLAMVQVIEIHLEYKFDTDVTLVVVVRTFFSFLENSWLWKEIYYESESLLKIEGFLPTRKWGVLTKI